jgi:SAM-dependent methyltransferase
MVNIFHHPPTAPVADEPALRAFRQQWQVYRKLVDGDYLSHRAVGAVLHRVFVEEVGRPFRFLDLACGDAGTTVAALRDTPVAHYRGIDLSAPALELARREVAALPCPAELEMADFATALRGRPDSADVAWVGLSVHHLQTADKLAFMRDVRAAVADRGVFMIYEPIRLEGQDRPAYLDAFEAAYRSCLATMTPDEWAVVVDHVRAADFPEEASVWLQLGRDAGFRDAAELFTDPAGFIKLFRFRP